MMTEPKEFSVTLSDKTFLCCENAAQTIYRKFSKKNAKI